MSQDEHFRIGREKRGQVGLRVRHTLDFAGLADHERMPARFFARLTMSDGALSARLQAAGR